MSQPNYNLDDVLDAELRDVPLPEGFMERLRQAALTDEDLDAAVREVPVPSRLDDRLRRPRSLWRRSLQDRRRMRRVTQWAVAMSLVLCVAVGCFAVMARFLIVASEARRASLPVAVQPPDKPVDLRPSRSWLCEMDDRFGPDSPDPLSGNRSHQWQGLLASHRVPLEPSEPKMVAEPRLREIQEPLEARASRDSCAVVSPTSNSQSPNKVVPLATQRPNPRTESDALGGGTENAAAREVRRRTRRVELGHRLVRGRPTARSPGAFRPVGAGEELFSAVPCRSPRHPQAAGANIYLGNLLMEQAGIKRAEAFERSRTPESKAELLDEARALYRDAKQAFTAVDAAIGEKLPRDGNVDKNDAKQLEPWRQLQRDAMLTGLAWPA